MTLVAAGDLLRRAEERDAAVAAFNVITLEHAEAIATGAERAGEGVILQISENAIRFHRGMRPIVAACREIGRAARVPVCVHLDHIRDPALADEAITLGIGFGIGSIMIDASDLTYERNSAVTAEFTGHARSAGLWVEAELGEVGGKDGAHAPGVRTDPADARDFVARIGVDALAVAVGSSHAMSTRTAELDLDLIALLGAAVGAPLVLHGSSGVPDEMIARAIRRGIRKVNVGTALNIAYTGELRERLADDDASSDPRPYLRDARSRVADTVARFCRVVAPR